MLSRRSLLAFAAALAATLAPRRARAADLAARKFLFVFARGGWDPTWVFAPDVDPALVDVDPEATPAEIGGLTFADAASRPNVRAFFERYAARTAIINGIEVRSLTHERCRRLLFCGAGEGEADDWATRIAASDRGWRLPHLVLGGPSFTAAHADAVVRLGDNNQLAELLSADAFRRSDSPIAVASANALTAAEAFAQKRAASWARDQASGQPQGVGAALVAAYERAALVRGEAALFDLGRDLGSDSLIPVPDRVSAALQCFEAGYSRCAIVEHLGQFELGWDTHSNNDVQGIHFDLLFGDLSTILDDMAARPGAGGASLLDETTVVVLSEMGRTPRLNAAGGKDHWTFTSAMLVGAGIRGGMVVGAYDDALVGRPVSLTTGAPEAGGTALRPEELGATLLALAGLEAEEMGGGSPILAVMDES